MPDRISGRCGCPSWWPTAPWISSIRAPTTGPWPASCQGPSCCCTPAPDTPSCSRTRRASCPPSNGSCAEPRVATLGLREQSRRFGQVPAQASREREGLMLPPRLIRRLVLAPLVVVIALAFIVLSPFLALLALVFGLAARSRPGRMRSLRLTCFALIWFIAETAALFMLLGLWIVSGFGGRLRTEPYQSRHYAVIKWFLDVMYDGAARTYGLRVEVDEPELTPEERIARLARPIIVLSRHAGPGDSFLLIHQLLSVYERRPRVVMKSALQLDPSVDVLGNRLPNVFIQHSKIGESLFTEQIERLARGLDQTGALVIFPEGGNWTPGRWRRGIRRLETTGHPDLAANAACPDADVIFVAHSGLDTIVSVRDVWRNFPIGQVIKARWWRVPHEEIPRDAPHDDQ